jgi:hypothetical protein
MKKRILNISHQKLYLDGAENIQLPLHRIYCTATGKQFSFDNQLSEG